MRQDTEMVRSTLHSAIEGSDIDRMLSLYDDDAEFTVIDHRHPPSKPLSLRGKGAIGDYLRDVYSRELKHKVLDEVVGDDRLALTDECEYPDGTHVFTSSLMDLKDDKIVREVEVQAWDETSPS